MESGKGSIYPCERLSGRDRATGVMVHQMTQHPSINHHAYFLQSSFTPDGEALIFTSYRTGSAQLFEARFPNGVIRQLTDGPPIHPFSATIHPGGEHIFFVRGGSIWRIERLTLEERCIVSFGQAQLGECSLAGEWLTAAARPGSCTGCWDSLELDPLPLDGVGLGNCRGGTGTPGRRHRAACGWMEHAADTL